VISRFIKLQLVVFSTLALIAALAIVFVYADLPGRYGYGKITITAMFANGSGIYANANVTQRGVTIGRVTDVASAGRDVAVRMMVDADRPIAADSRADIRSVSAVGEQYVDFVAPRDGGPYLRDGDVIPIAQTTIPQQIAPALDQVDTLLASVPKAGLDTFLDEGYKAFANLGPDLETLTDSTISLVNSANENYAQTKQLVQQAGPLLDTQNSTADSVMNYTRDLAHFTGALAGADGHLRGALPKVASAAELVDELFQNNEHSIPVLASNVRTVGSVLGIYRDGLEQVLVTEPLILAWEQIVSRQGRGLEVAFDTNLPEQCNSGYHPETRRSPWDITDAPADADTYCKVPQSDPRAVRGVRNIPCLEGVRGRRAATIPQCYGRTGFEPISGARGDTPIAVDNPLNAQHDGLVSNPPNDEPLFLIGAIGTPAPQLGKGERWESLLTGSGS
jgi:phospholipid/cholesterol/gamma-HCH transport system substrate-binding protein